MSGRSYGESERPRGKAASFVLVGVIVVTLLVDMLLIAAGLQDQLPLPALLVLHLSLAPFIWLTTRKCDPSLAGMALIAIMAMGPVGALGTLLLAIRLAPGRKSADGSLAEWHLKLAKPVKTDLAQELSQAVSEGRMVERGSLEPANFQAVSQFGSVSQRQTMLGLVSQRFDPGFSALLRQELRSEEAAVRVSAAAVFTKLRDRNRIRMAVGKRLPNLLTADDARERGIALARGLRSGLLDQSEVESARDQSLELLLQARPRVSETDELEELISTLLFEARRFQELEKRLATIDPGNSSILRSLQARLLMRAGRMSEAAKVMRHHQAGSVRLNLTRRLDSEHALLAHRQEDGS
jgi:hypothetical protein